MNIPKRPNALDEVFFHMAMGVPASKEEREDEATCEAREEALHSCPDSFEREKSDAELEVEEMEREAVAYEELPPFVQELPSKYHSQFIGLPKEAMDFHYEILQEQREEWAGERENNIAQAAEEDGLGSRGPRKRWWMEQHGDCARCMTRLPKDSCAFLLGEMKWLCVDCEKLEREREGRTLY